MRLKKMIRGLLLGLALAPGLGQAASGADEGGFSEANTLLFLQDHLTQVQYPAKYTYVAERTGAGDDNYQDRITMTALNVAGSDAKRVEFDLWAKDRGRQVQAVDNARGNPLIMVFLQSDVLGLAEATGGHWRYFQKQMKLALENDAQVEPVTLEFQGKQIAGQRITVRPYVNDPARSNELGVYREKTYEFVVSDQVPGTILELRSTVPGAGESDPVVERVTLQTVANLEAQG